MGLDLSHGRTGVSIHMIMKMMRNEKRDVECTGTKNKLCWNRKSEIDAMSDESVIIDDQSTKLTTVLWRTVWYGCW